MLRIATGEDVAAMHAVRLAVLENPLRNRTWVTPDDYRRLLESGGRGWVYQSRGRLLGFGLADHGRRNVWALFVMPGSERKGIGRALHDVMVDWLFSVGTTPICLATAPHTRAAGFYVAAGWRETGRLGDAEIFFEMARRPAGRSP